MIQFTEFGNTGITVSRAVLGCGFRGLYSTKEAQDVILGAIDLGINFIDCANVYRLRSGEYSEPILGKVLKTKRDKIFFSSKFGAPFVLDSNKILKGASKEVMDSCIDISLKRLGTDYIDVYLLHGPDPNTPYEEVVENFNSLIKDGKIKNWGLCNHSASQIEDCCKYAEQKGLIGPSVIQNAYNLVNRQPEDGILDVINRRNVGFMVYSPLAAGLLSGAFARGKRPPEKSTWTYDNAYRKYLEVFFPGKIENVVELLHDIANKKGVSSASIAISWLLKKREVSCCLLGADTVEEIKDSITAFDVELDDSEYELLNSLSVGLRESLTAYEVAAKVAQFDKK